MCVAGHVEESHSPTQRLKELVRVAVFLRDNINAFASPRLWFHLETKVCAAYYPASPDGSVSDAHLTCFLPLQANKGTLTYVW